MHVLIIPPDRYVSEDKKQGSIFQYDQAHALRRAGLKVGVIAPAPRSLRNFKIRSDQWPSGIQLENDQGVPVYRWQGWGWTAGRVPYLTTWLWNRVGLALYHRYTTEQGMPDIIHAHNALFGGSLAAELVKKQPVPVVLTEHLSWLADGRLPGWMSGQVALGLQTARARLMVSSALGKSVQAQFGEIAVPWQWVPNILPSIFESAALAEYQPGSRSPGFRFLHVGNLVEVKNQAGLLQAFAARFKGQQTIRLHIVGDGLLRADLETLTVKLGISSQVSFLGQLSREGVMAEMQACDAFVLFSHVETFGVVLIEALACGRPVIATSGSGPDDIVHVGNGLLVPPRDVNTLGQAMQDIVKNIKEYDPVSIRQDCLARFGEQVVVQKLIEIYRQVLASTHPEQLRSSH